MYSYKDTVKGGKGLQLESLMSFVKWSSPFEKWYTALNWRCNGGWESAMHQSGVAAEAVGQVMSFFSLCGKENIIVHGSTKYLIEQKASLTNSSN